MPQTFMNFRDRRRETRHNYFRANSLVNGQIPATGLVNGDASFNGCPATTSRIRQSTPVTGTKPQQTVNGYVNHRDKGKGPKSPPSGTPRKRGDRISADDAVRNGDISVCVSVNGTAGPVSDASPSNSDQMAPDSSLAAARKKHRRWKKFRSNQRDTEVVCPKDSVPPLMPPQEEEEEDWDKEIQEVTLTGWEKMCFGRRPYGPEDVLHFSLRDLTLKQLDTVPPPLTANYSPAAHHPRPVRWTCYNIPSEQGQYADADDDAKTCQGCNPPLTRCTLGWNPVGQSAADVAGARLRAALSMVSPTMKALVDAVWAVWSIGASIYDYMNTNAMEERIHTLEHVITIHECVIGMLSAGILGLFTYICFKKL